MIAIDRFGRTPDGQEAHVFTLTSPDCGVEVRLSDFGATVLGITCPDRTGEPADIVLGFGELAGYAGVNAACYGGTIGSVANRTEGASVEVAGEVWHLEPNEGENNLHTSLGHGFHKRLWSATVDEAANAVTFSCMLAHGELGLPGERTATVRYELTGSTLTLTQRCETDRPTFANMTNHTYFNLAGHGSGTVEDQMVTIEAASYLPIREDSVTTGAVEPVTGTPFDLRYGKRLGEGLGSEDEQIRLGRGYDHCFCVDGFEPGAAPRRALAAEDSASGRALEVFITQPGIQLYTGNWLDDEPVKDGGAYGPRAGFAVEPEYYPNGMHHADWPQPICTPEHPYEETIVYRFGTTETLGAQEAHVEG